MAFVWTIFNIRIPTLIGDFRVSVFSTLSTGDLHLKAPSWNLTPPWPATQGQTGEQSTHHKGGLCLFSLSACRAETQGSVVTGPRASQPPVVTNRPACLPGSQGAHLAPTWSQHPCPMFCPLTGHTEGPHTSEALLQDQLSPYIFCRVPSHCGISPLSLVSGVAPWTPRCQPLLLSAQQTTSHKVHVARSAARPGTPSPPHILVSQTCSGTTPRHHPRPSATKEARDIFTTGHLCSQETWVISEDEEGKAHRTSAGSTARPDEGEPHFRLGSQLRAEWIHPGQRSLQSQGGT